MDSSIESDKYRVSIDELDRTEWSAILDRFQDATFYQTWEYGAIRWGENNLSHMVLKKGETIISAAQIRILSVPLLGPKMAYIRYGPMWKSEGESKNLMNFQLGLQALIDEYAINRGLFLRVRAWGFIEKDIEMETSLIRIGFKRTKGLFKNKDLTILIDLKPSVEDMRKRLKKKWRQTLQKAEKKQSVILETFNNKFFPQLISLFRETIQIKKFKPGSDVEEFSKIQKELSQKQKLRLTICKTDGKIVSGSVCSDIGDTVIGILSATGEEGRRAQAYYLLQWDEILWAKKKGKIFYDLGGINPKTNPGVYRFKAGIGGQELTRLGVFDFCRSKILYHLIISFEGIVRIYTQLHQAVVPKNWTIC